ncbi:hypothetical protein THAOC_25600 [Thalassiosira oceanica]|uniref:Uncharacterized protein n=1 Tax=Thalassiosira oceanica TaxID=159749 RepID=K0RNY1_THAOC|nr:hypothetical protein THAOC_25600 [Thalassiosira oceanica]|eukprot:EJK54745.1 hypothetical protein THAOC_25600 [Thalassiosira oceanica]
MCGPGHCRRGLGLNVNPLVPAQSLLEARIPPEELSSPGKQGVNLGVNLAKFTRRKFPPRKVPTSIAGKNLGDADGPEDSRRHKYEATWVSARPCDAAGTVGTVGPAAPPSSRAGRRSKPRDGRGRSDQGRGPLLPLLQRSAPGRWALCAARGQATGVTRPAQRDQTGYETQDLSLKETMPQLIGVSESYLLIIKRKGAA